MEGIGLSMRMYTPTITLMILLRLTGVMDMEDRMSDIENKRITNCNGLKMIASDGKMRVNDVPVN